MSGYTRIRRQQLIREAEGYLDLILLFADRWPPSVESRDRLALRTLEVLLRLDQQDANCVDALHLRGQALRTMERHEEAIQPLRQAAEQDPENIHIHLALGWCYKRIGRLDLAIEALEEALELDRNQAIIHYNLACYWSLAKNVGLTLAYLSQAFELDSDYRDLVATEPDFDPVRDHPEFLALTTVIV